MFPSTVFASEIATREVLPNGLVLLQSEQHNLPIVMVTLAIKAGSLVEPAEKAGLANLTASLLTEGTKTRTASEISDEIEFVGGDLSSSGGSDYITVTLSILKKDVDKGFELLSDIVLNPAFSGDEIKRKKALIKGTLKAEEEEPSIVASRAFKKAIFGDGPYGRPVKGFPETIDRITRDDILDFYSRFYASNNAIMAVVGDLNRSELKALMDKYFRGWKQKDIKPVLYLQPSEPTSPKLIKIDRDVTQANIVLGHIGIKRDNPDFYAVSVMNYILGGGGFASRLMTDIREEKGLAYDVESFFLPQKETGGFEVVLQTRNESANTAVEEVLKEVKGMMADPVSEKELGDAKSFLTGSFPLRIDTSRKIADFLAAVEYYGLGLDYVQRYPEYIREVTREDVLRVARKYLHPDRYILVVVANQRKAGVKY